MSGFCFLMYLINLGITAEAFEDLRSIKLTLSAISFKKGPTAFETTRSIFKSHLAKPFAVFNIDFSAPPPLREPIKIAIFLNQIIVGNGRSHPAIEPHLKD